MFAVNRVSVELTLSAWLIIIDQYVHVTLVMLVMLELNVELLKILNAEATQTVQCVIFVSMIDA